jgi:acetyl-CoA carboxylase carboxyl transferase subunit alpha
VVRLTEEVRRLRRRFQERGEESEVWDVVQNARHRDRPYTLDYAGRLFSDFLELHGDRIASDDPALVAGIATYHRRPVVVIGHQKGRDADERRHRNFGMARPEGYRKAIRVIELADRLGLPILTFIDTPGAYPGVGAEQGGQAGIIARSILALARVEVPVICTVIGEGGSGGALAIAVGDRILMQENAIYSVISPEGCAAILWKDAGQAKKAAYAFRPVARACLDLGVIDQIVPEPPGGAHKDHDRAARLLDDALRAALE